MRGFGRISNIVNAWGRSRVNPESWNVLSLSPAITATWLSQKAFMVEMLKNVFRMDRVFNGWQEVWDNETNGKKMVHKGWYGVEDE